MSANVLVVYASHHEATHGIADRIAEVLRESGHRAIVRPASDPGGIDAYDAFVVGSAVYMFHWIKDARSFVRRHARALSQRPTWFFSSGPLGPVAAGHEADTQPRELPELVAAAHPREHRVFAGAYDPASRPVGFMERLSRMMPATRDLLPAGDFREWAEIDEWAKEIAAALEAVPAAAG
jgi:menaquinone-dependent protoporphyrinogen oxidase